MDVFILIAAWTPQQFWLVVGFSFLIGSCVGSFLNVVVYRLEVGMSLVTPPSRCPKCETPIRSFDNLPIVGWLKLGGKCRACKSPISARYPLVELTVALVFVSLAWFEPLGVGLNLPRLATDVVPGPNEMLRPGGPIRLPILWAIYAFHLLLLCRLLVESQWEQDGYQPVRHRGFLVMAILAFVIPIWQPWVHPLPASTEIAERLGAQLWAAGPLDTLIGGVVACVLGMLATPAMSVGPRGESGRQEAILSVMLVGFFLGWQAVTGIMGATAVLVCLAVMFRPAIKRLHDFPYTRCLFLVTWIWILGWRDFTKLGDRLAEEIERIDRYNLPIAPVALGIAGLLVTILSAITWCFRGSSPGKAGDTSPT